MRRALDWQPAATLQPLRLPWLARAQVEVAVLRLDLVDPLLSGNKWFKLLGHLRSAVDSGAQGLISLGGAHSNHLHALAAAGRRFGFECVGLLRGEEQETPTVAALRELGMRLHWLGHGGYRQRHAPGFWTPWRERYPHLQPVPEGGGGPAGTIGCARLAELAAGWEHHGWWLAVGTGTTLAGLVLAEAGARPVYGALAVPARYGVQRQVDELLAGAGRRGGYRLFEACRGGFARVDGELLAFMAESEAVAGLPLEPVYTAKALLALKQQVEAAAFPPGTRLLFVHTGGLQGRAAALARAAVCR